MKIIKIFSNTVIIISIQYIKKLILIKFLIMKKYILHFLTMILSFIFAIKFSKQKLNKSMIMKNKLIFLFFCLNFSFSIGLFSLLL